MPPLSNDFTIAKILDSAGRIGRVEAAISAMGSEKIAVTRHDIDAELPADAGLDTLEAEAIFTGLILNDAAEKVGYETPFVDATFELVVPRVRRVLREQAAASTALETVAGNPRTESDTEVVATVPPQLDIELPPSVKSLDTAVRSALLDATDVVRIANPYFDPGHPTVETLQTLPQRGVETRVLTRNVDPGTDRHTVLESMWTSLPPDDRELLSVAELYENDSAGYQVYSTHAKLVVVDEERCYLGSANFTTTNLTTNFEIGIMNSGPAVPVIAETFDNVFDVARSVPLGE